MMDAIFNNLLSVLLFYFFIFIPVYSLVFLRAFSRFQNRFVGIEKTYGQCFVYSYGVWGILSLFAISLSYLLLLTTTGSYFFLVHFFLVVPILSFLLSFVISWMSGKGALEWASYLGILLCSFSLFSAMVYMILRLFLESV